MNSSALLRVARPAFRQRANLFASPAQRTTFRKAFKGRRYQSTAAPAEAQVSWFKKAWDSPVGIKTVHFWAPVMKWCLVLAGVADFARPAEKLSLTQNLALTATGIIWTRWCFIIKPRNILLAAVNFFLGVVGIIQVGRITMYNYSQGETTKQQIEEAKESVVSVTKSAKGQVEDAIKKS